MSVLRHCTPNQRVWSAVSCHEASLKAIYFEQVAQAEPQSAPAAVPNCACTSAVAHSSFSQNCITDAIPVNKLVQTSVSACSQKSGVCPRAHMQHNPSRNTSHLQFVPQLLARLKGYNMTNIHRYRHSLKSSMQHTFSVSFCRVQRGKIRCLHCIHCYAPRFLPSCSRP